MKQVIALTVLSVLFALLCSCSAEFGGREVSEGAFIDPNGGKSGSAGIVIDPNGGKSGSAGVIIDPNGGKGSSSRGTMDPDGRTVSLRAEWMD